MQKSCTVFIMCDFYSYRAGNIQFSCLDIVNERDVILRVPILAVTDTIKWNTLQKLVDGSNNLK